MSLLYLGITNVITSVARIADDTSLNLMTAEHHAPSTGAQPAEARARPPNRAAPLIRLLRRRLSLLWVQLPVTCKRNQPWP